jgi:large subunit ribosomal protein L5
MAPRLLEKYRSEIVPQLMKEFSLSNRMAAPFVEKVVVNMGVGEGMQDIKILEKAMDELSAIVGQRPVIRRAKKSISNFKVREGHPVGCKVTLRKSRMYEFMDRLFNVTMPRIRDFRGVPVNSFDKAGNYTLGLSEQAVFPELEVDKINRAQGMDITFVIKNTENKEQSKALLRLLGMPFKTE